jgi:chemotaxis protein MotB
MKGKPFETNWGLSTARAVAVVEYLAEKHRIPSSRLAAVGFADGRPIASNSTSEGRARNRRVEFEIKPKAGQAFQGIEELNGKIGEE